VIGLVALGDPTDPWFEQLVSALRANVLVTRAGPARSCIPDGRADRGCRRGRPADRRPRTSGRSGAGTEDDRRLLFDDTARRYPDEIGSGANPRECAARGSPRRLPRPYSCSSASETACGRLGEVDGMPRSRHHSAV
jgi:hypothetical protein